jgi:hypothetical protein
VKLLKGKRLQSELNTSLFRAIRGSHSTVSGQHQFGRLDKDDRDVVSSDAL